MAVPPEAIHDYYRRAASLATAIRRQATDPTETSTDTSTSTTSSTSSTPSSSSSSTRSTSSSSTPTSAPTRPTSSIASPTSMSTLTSDVASTVSSQYVTTNSSGQIVTTTFIIIPTNTSTDSGASSSPPTGAIVGGVVGGIALIALIGLGIFLIRRKMKRDEFEANIFDPDRNVERPTSVGAGPRFDLSGAGGGAAAAGAGVGGMAAMDPASHVTPYSYGAPTSTGPTSTNHGSSVIGQPEMQQAQPTGYYSEPYSQVNYPQYPQSSVGVGEHFPNPYAPGYHPAAAMAGGAALGAGMAGHAVQRGQTMSSGSSGYPTSPVHSGQSYDGMSHPGSPPMAAAVMPAQNTRSAKEREAFARTNQHQQYSTGNPTDQRNPSPTPSGNRSSVVGSSAVGPTSPVVVHQDGGRVQEDEDGNEEAEIPPTYDSIPRH